MEFLSTIIGALKAGPLLNQFGIFLPYIALILLIVGFSKVTTNNSFLFKKPNELKYPKAFLKHLTSKMGLKGIANIVIGLLLIKLGARFVIFSYFGWILIGVGLGLLSLKMVSKFFPSNKSGFTSSKNKLSLLDALILSSVIYYFFIDYFQLIWPSMREDQVLGLIRYKFYFIGMAIYNILVQAIIMMAGKHRINTISVIVLFFMCNWYLYNLLNAAFEDNFHLEFKVLLCLIACSITIFLVDSANAYKKIAKAKKDMSLD